MIWSNRRKIEIVNGIKYLECFRCKKMLPEQEFNPAGLKKNRYLNKCTECEKEFQEWNKQEREKIFYYRNPDLLDLKIEEEQRKREEQQKEKEKPQKEDKHLPTSLTPKEAKKLRRRLIRKAHNKIRARTRYLVASGKLHKPSRCELCCKSGMLQAHHWCYSEEHLFDVVWVCFPCHERIHFLEANPKADPKDSTGWWKLIYKLNDKI